MNYIFNCSVCSVSSHHFVLVLFVFFFFSLFDLVVVFFGVFTTFEVQLFELDAALFSHIVSMMATHKKRLTNKQLRRFETKKNRKQKLN